MRKNEGLSYGSFSYAFGKTRGDGYTHFVFTEDDYAFINFDIDAYDEILRSNKNIGFLCAKATHRFRMHASVSIGLSPIAALEKIYSKRGFLPYIEDHFNDSVKKEDRNYVFDNQIAFSYGFIDAGFEIRDFPEFGHSTAFYNSRTKELAMFPEVNQDGRKVVCFPIQPMLNGVIP